MNSAALIWPTRSPKLSRPIARPPRMIVKLSHERNVRSLAKKTFGSTRVGSAILLPVFYHQTFTSVVSFQSFYQFALCSACCSSVADTATGCKGPIGSLPGADCRRGWLDMVNGRQRAIEGWRVHAVRRIYQTLGCRCVKGSQNAS